MAKDDRTGGRIVLSSGKIGPFRECRRVWPDGLRNRIALAIEI